MEAELNGKALRRGSCSSRWQVNIYDLYFQLITITFFDFIYRQKLNIAFSKDFYGLSMTIYEQYTIKNRA